jgi:hypothetical protein
LSSTRPTCRTHPDTITPPHRRTRPAFPRHQTRVTAYLSAPGSRARVRYHVTFRPNRTVGQKCVASMAGERAARATAHPGRVYVSGSSDSAKALLSGARTRCWCVQALAMQAQKAHCGQKAVFQRSRLVASMPKLDVGIVGRTTAVPCGISERPIFARDRPGRISSPKCGKCGISAVETLSESSEHREVHTGGASRAGGIGEACAAGSGRGKGARRAQVLVCRLVHSAAP